MPRPAKTALFIVIGAYATFYAAYSWSPLAVDQDQNLFMPGSQPGSAVLEKASQCDNCHGGYDPGAEPAHNWRGGMMAHAARDPLWLACLAVANQDSIWALGNPNAGDLCLRCHTPGGWIEGRSDPPNASALTSSRGDFEGVNCDSCHRMIDPFNALSQMPELPAETDSVGISKAEETRQRDAEVLTNIALFDSSPFYDPGTGLPVHFGDGSLPGYIESTSGQYYIDPADDKRGPRFDASPKHKWYYSRYHKSKFMCATCHDVSNPVLANVLLSPGLPERQSPASFFHLERTWSEFSLSDYGLDGGAATNPSVAESGVVWASKCQDCHMSDVTGKACNKNVATRTDLALHDQTGGNTWMSRLLATADQNGPVYDPYNYAILSGSKYPGARIDVDGLNNLADELLDGEARARANLHRAADITLVADMSHAATVRLINNTGHKLISGFPEGRRMWLSVKFHDAGGNVIGELNPYQPLSTTLDAQGNEQYVSGGILQVTRDDLVYEAQMSSSLTGETKTFHFVLATDRYKDNRIPPRGFDIACAGERLVIPCWQGAEAIDYFTAAEYAGGYDEVTFAKPQGTAGWTATLYYQTTSKEYIEFLRDEIVGDASTLSSPTPSGEAQAYIIQDTQEPNLSFFANLKDWGQAIWDLWLHNGGAAPVDMTAAISPPREMEIQQEPDGTRLRFATIVGRNYQVQYHGDLTTGSWTDLGGPIAGHGGVTEITDPAPAAAPRRFYRVVTTVP